MTSIKNNPTPAPLTSKKREVANKAKSPKTVSYTHLDVYKRQPLVMNTFAKSYIINLACDAALASSKVNAVVVNIGGDLVTKGNVEEYVNVTNPLACLLYTSRCV